MEETLNACYHLNVTVVNLHGIKMVRTIVYLHAELSLTLRLRILGCKYTGVLISS
jgi:hypothetical protein